MKLMPRVLGNGLKCQEHTKIMPQTICYWELIFQNYEDLASKINTPHQKCGTKLGVVEMVAGRTTLV